MPLIKAMTYQADIRELAMMESNSVIASHWLHLELSLNMTQRQLTRASCLFMLGHNCPSQPVVEKKKMYLSKSIAI